MKISQQAEIDQLVARLPAAIAASEEELVSWMGKFAHINDNNRISYDRAAIAALLRGAGYSRPASSETITLEKHGRAAFRRRIIEFSLYFLETGMPLPHAVVTYVAFYFKTVGKKWSCSSRN
jgi:hypothetical protein